MVTTAPEDNSISRHQCVIDCLLYTSICDSFLEAGADIFVLETFPDTQYVLKMAEYIRKSCPEAFIIGQFSLTPTGYSRTGFHYKTILQEATQSGLLDLSLIHI